MKFYSFNKQNVFKIQKNSIKIKMNIWNENGNHKQEEQCFKGVFNINTFASFLKYIAYEYVKQNLNTTFFLFLFIYFYTYIYEQAFQIIHTSHEVFQSVRLTRFDLNLSMTPRMCSERGT